MTTEKNVGLAIRDVRKQRKLNQKQLAKKAEISLRQLGRYERGEDIPSSTLTRLAKILGVSVSSLTEGGDKPVLLFEQLPKEMQTPIEQIMKICIEMKKKLKGKR
jgi:transcriptional regulator with XRE-family HTH domain